jgi:hypothetical protein
VIYSETEDGDLVEVERISKWLPGP